MRTRLTTGAVLAAAVALAGSALAAPTTLTLDSVSVAGGVATGTGTVVFGDAGNGDVGGTVVTASPAQARPAFGAGVDLKSASITPSPDGKGLRFTWQLTDLPASPPPEAVRYTWSFGVGGKTFQLQAKRSNAASSTAPDDPAGHLSSAAAGAFQLRGDCGTLQGTSVANCPHLQFLKGAFDTAKDQVTMDLPFGTRGIDRGALLVPVQTATMSITAGYQAVVSNTTTSTYINDWAPYYTAPVVELATGVAGEDQTALTFTRATVTDGAFSGSVPVQSDTDVLVARACQATECVYVEKRLS